MNSNTKITRDHFWPYHGVSNMKNPLLCTDYNNPLGTYIETFVHVKGKCFEVSILLYLKKRSTLYY